MPDLTTISLSPENCASDLRDVSKGKAEGCLTGNSVALKFDERVRPFVLEGIKWEEK